MSATLLILVGTIKQTLGVDLDALLAEHFDALQTSIDDGYETTLAALAALSTLTDEDVIRMAALRLAFAVGYKAGKEAPDLSVFEDALRDGGDGKC